MERVLNMSSSTGPESMLKIRDWKKNTVVYSEFQQQHKIILSQINAYHQSSILTTKNKDSLQITTDTKKMRGEYTEITRKLHGRIFLESMQEIPKGRQDITDDSKVR